MARDFTDYVVEILGCGERAIHRHHIRQLSKDEPVSEYVYNGRSYQVIKDRAKRAPASYHPWKMWDRKHPFRSLREMLRSKKIGVISYREPRTPLAPMFQDVETKIPVGYSCKICADKDTPFITKHERSMKGHATRFHKRAKYDMITHIEYNTHVEKVQVMETVEPFHVSRMHQPSGRLVGDDPEPTPKDAAPGMPMLEGEGNWPPLTETISPRMFKAIVDSPQLRRAYKSFKFGNITPLNTKWWLWLVIAIVGVFAILIMTGNFHVRG